MTVQQRRRVKAIVAVAVFAIALLGRIVLYTQDVAYGDRLTILTFLVALSAAFASGYTAVWYRSRNGTASSTPASISEILTAASGAIAIAIVLYGGLQVLLPNTPQAAAASACRGVAIAGAAALGQTVSSGANARSGAGSAYPVKDRFFGGCTVGFDGFCVGEPIKNDLTTLPDQRWLIVHSRKEVVSASLISLQSPQSDLGTQPAKQCSDQFDGVNGAETLSWTAEANGTASVLHAISPGAVLIGFAASYTGGQAVGAYPYVNAGFYSPDPDFVGRSTTSTSWDQEDSPIPLANGTGTVLVVGEACYADDAPIEATAKFKRLTYVRGVLDKAEDVPFSPSFEVLRHQACSIV